MRYKGKQIFNNDEEYYEYLRRSRGIRAVQHYATPKMRNPTISDRGRLGGTQHIWSYGDRLSNIAFKFYGDVRYWWVVAWYNGVGTEADIAIGDVLTIPLDLGATLSVLGV